VKRLRDKISMQKVSKKNINIFRKSKKNNCKGIEKKFLKHSCEFV